MPRIFSYVLRLFLILLVLLPGSAIAAVTSGTLKGTVVDDADTEIPGVRVTIKSEALMGVRQQETDAEGRYFFAQLPPGEYVIIAEFPGFNTEKRTGVPVNIGRTTEINISMKATTGEATIESEVARPVIDTESGNVSTVLTKDFLERLPAGRSYQEVVQMAAGVTGGGNPNVAGSGSSENTYMLDGVNITDPVTGTFSLNFNFDAIEQLEILVAAYDPEYGINLGGGINIVTASGSNTLKVQTGLYMENGEWSPKLDSIFAADGLELVSTDFDSRFTLYSAGIVVSGPIIRDKAWFLASYENARSLIAFSGNPLPRDYEQHSVFTKVTVQPVSAHRFSLAIQSDPTTVDNIFQGSRFIEPEAQGRQAQGGWLGMLSWDWFISPEAFVETKATVQKSFIEVHQVPCSHDQDLGYNPCSPDEMDNTIDFFTPARFGQNNAYDSDNAYVFDIGDRWRAEVQTKFSLLQIEALGTHDFKTGVTADFTSTHRSVGFSGNLYFVDLNTQYYNPDTLKNYYWVELSGPHDYVMNAQTLGFFIQDVYKPVDNLTLRYGFRYDRQDFRNDLGDSILATGLFGPRFSANWDPWGKGKSKLTGSVGRFNDTSRLEVADYLNASGSGFGSKLFLGEYFGEFTNEANLDYSYSSPDNTNTVLPGLTAPRADMFTLGAEQEIIQDLAVKIYFNGKFTRNLYALDEVNGVWDETGYANIGFSNGEFEYLNRLRTPSIARRDYWWTEFRLEKVFSNRWQAQASYTYAISKGSVQESPSYFLSVAPQLQYATNAYLGTDIRHDITGAITWDVPDDPWTTQLALLIFAESGYPMDQYYDSAYGAGSIRKFTRGTYARTEGYWYLSSRVEQQIPVRKGKLSGVLQVNNFTNNRSGSGAGITADNRWVYGRQSPISVQLGAEYQL
jgi:hypothetical protein